MAEGMSTVLTESHLSFLSGLKNLATKWKRIGVHLKVPVEDLNIIQENNKGGVNPVLVCLQEMFSLRLRNGSDVTVRELINAVRDVGEHRAEVEIKEKFGISLEVPCLPTDGIQNLPCGEFNLSGSVQRYCKDKKEMYKKQSDLPESEWPPSLGGTYIRLALIKQERSMYEHTLKSVIKRQIDYTRGDYDKIMTDKTRIELIEAFGRGSEGGKEVELRMLIDGAPGVGKTTLSRNVSKRWAKKDILQRFWLVLLLHLRESAVSNAKTIDEFFYHEDPDVQQSVAKFVKEKSGDGVLIIFDGFDELSANERSKQSLFLDVIKGKILPKCAVVVTSRPYASRSVQELPQINRHVEVLGFTDDQVKTCIKQKITDQKKAEELCTELKDRLDIASICQIPLNCSVVLYVYELENYCLPRTLTELYGLFILHCLKRFVTRTQNDENAANRLLDLINLEPPNRERFESLCKLAVTGLEDDKLVFSRDDVEKCFPSEYHKLGSDPPVLDLMTSAKSYSSRGAHDTYNFLHLTIQEFLAAYQIAHSSSDADKLDFLKENLLNDRFRMVLLFLAGMTKLEFHNAASIFCRTSWNMDKVHICHLTYEAESHHLCKLISEKCCDSPKEIELTGTSFDALVVSDFVANSNCQWAEVTFNAERILLVHKQFSSERLHSTAFIKNMAVVFDSNDENNFTHLDYLEELSQVNQISIVVKLSSARTKQGRLANEKLIKSIGNFLQLVRRKQYSLVLHLSYNTNVSVAQFCKTLAVCLSQNCSVTEVILNSVLSKDIECIFEGFGSKKSVSCLKRLVCNSTHRRPKHLSEKISDSHSFLAILTSFCSRNTSLQEVVLELNLEYDIVRDNVDNLLSALANNSTLQQLTIFECDSIVFQRNPESKQMELTHPPRKKQKRNLSMMSPVIGESSIAPCVLPPSERPCEQSLDNSGVYHSSPAGPSRSAHSSTPSRPHFGSATEPSQSSPFSDSIPFASRNPSRFCPSSSSYQHSGAIPSFQSQTDSMPPPLVSIIPSSNSIQPESMQMELTHPPRKKQKRNLSMMSPAIGESSIAPSVLPPSERPCEQSLDNSGVYHSSPAGPSCSAHSSTPSIPHFGSATESSQSSPFSDSIPFASRNPSGYSPSSSSYQHRGVIPSFQSQTDSMPPPQISINPSSNSIQPDCSFQSSISFLSEHHLLANQHGNVAMNELSLPSQQQHHKVMAGSHNVLQHMSSSGVSYSVGSSALTAQPSSHSTANQQCLSVQLPQFPDQRSWNSFMSAIQLPRVAWLQSIATPHVSPYIPCQPEAASALLGFPQPVWSPQQRMHLQQQAYTPNQSTTGTTSTTCTFTTTTVPSASTHGFL